MILSSVLKHLKDIAGLKKGGQKPRLYYDFFPDLSLYNLSSDRALALWYFSDYGLFVEDESVFFVGDKTTKHFYERMADKCL